jgi:hypothetical protein
MDSLRRFTLPADKANHLVWGFVAAAVAGTLAIAFGWAAQAGWVGAAAATLVSVLKEAADDMANEEAELLGDPPPHTVDFKDAAAGVIGGLAWWLALALGGLASNAA